MAAAATPAAAPASAATSTEAPVMSSERGPGPWAGRYNLPEPTVPHAQVQLDVSRRFQAARLQWQRDHGTPPAQVALGYVPFVGTMFAAFACGTTVGRGQPEANACANMVLGIGGLWTQGAVIVAIGVADTSVSMSGDLPDVLPGASSGKGGGRSIPERLMEKVPYDANVNPTDPAKLPYHAPP